MHDDNDRILVILTGGTICSEANREGLRYANAEKVRIIEKYQNSDSLFCHRVCFEKVTPLNILSENMTVAGWNTLLSALKDVDQDRYKGIILLHGTDTLAYTACLLSLVLAGMKIPLCLVSSQLPLDHSNTNGHANFRTAVELIMNGIAPNVYAVYRNSDQVTYVHYGAHLVQCGDYSDDFYSKDPMTVPDVENAQLTGVPYETDSLYLRKISPLTPCVLQVKPYVGLDYGALRLEGVRAIVHGTYHSQSLCVAGEDTSSALSLLDRCKQRSIPLFLAPCSADAFQYESTGDALSRGALPVYGLTGEMAYVKALVGCALGLSNTALQEFLNASVNHEFIA